MSALTSQNGLGFLTDEERNFLLLMKGGGANSVVVELGIKRDEVQPRFVAIKAKIEQHIARRAEQAAGLEEDGDVQDPVHRLDPATHDWPHTNGVVRRQIVDDEAAVIGRIKRQRNGAPARGTVLGTGPQPVDEDELPEGFEPEDEPEKIDRNPSRSPILDWLTAHRSGSAPQIADCLERKPGNVATRLRQLERGGYVRRTGRTVPGGRGGPQVEFELSDPDKRPTSVDDVLSSPPSEESTRERLGRLEAAMTTPRSDLTGLRERYCDALLARLEGADGDLFDRIADRIERLVGVGS